MMAGVSLAYTERNKKNAWVCCFGVILLRKKLMMASFCHIKYNSILNGIVSEV